MVACRRATKLRTLRTVMASFVLWHTSIVRIRVCKRRPITLSTWLSREVVWHSSLVSLDESSLSLFELDIDRASAAACWERRQYSDPCLATQPATNVSPALDSCTALQGDGTATIPRPASRSIAIGMAPVPPGTMMHPSVPYSTLWYDTRQRSPTPQGRRVRFATRLQGAGART